ncbi:hypothetical protein FF80_02513 [Devosia sp. LC5]|uniref:hypothetical protein n=1 Tax=Devosia sp. LC5 TaxID=1502724 RepID=UPI0004E42214|nr:hypothetical protein [Devosia sp. LC5]KFC66252.1 hypothetical protein FF80_02513 [Devosia sp. LC5]
MSLAAKRGPRPFAQNFNRPEAVDRSFVVRRLHRNAASLVSAHPRADYVGADDLTESLARAKGFSHDDLAILRISIGAKRHTMICVPSNIWHSRKFDLIELKDMANAAARACILVPESAIQREPRLSVARAIEEAFGVTVGLEDRMAILVHMIEAGGQSSIMDCACAIVHPEPFSAVLHMVALGVLKMTASGDLTPHSVVCLADTTIA